MPIKLRSEDEVARMRVAGRLAASVLEMIGPHVATGRHAPTNSIASATASSSTNSTRFPRRSTTATRRASRRSRSRSARRSITSSATAFRPPNKRLKRGDVVNIDVTVIKDRYHGDTSKMFFVGEPSVMARRLVEITQECLYRGIRVVRPGAHLGDIGHAIQSHAEANNLSVVREFCGHGIGDVFHDEPQVLHYGRPTPASKLEAGMTFTIEPMINAGQRHVKMLPDQWTVVTKDHKLSAQWEHTILVTPTALKC